MHRVIHVRRQAQEISGHRIVTEPKTEAGVRSLSLPGALSLRASRPTSLPTPLRVRPVPSFTGRSGLPLRRGDLSEESAAPGRGRWALRSSDP